MAVVFRESKFDRKYLIKNVTHAIGVSESSLTAYFNNRKVSVSKGITIDQIYDFIRNNEIAFNGIDWDDVNEIEKLLNDLQAICAEGGFAVEYVMGAKRGTLYLDKAKGELAVAVAPAQGEKCERCWKNHIKVGAHADHPGLCPRCAKVVSAIDPALLAE